MEMNERRLEVHLRHLIPEKSSSEFFQADSLEHESCAGSKKPAVSMPAIFTGSRRPSTRKSVSFSTPQPSFDVKKLADIMVGDSRETRDAVWEIFKDPIFKRKYGATKEEQREITWKRVAKFAQSGLLKLEYLKSNPKAYMTVMEYMGYFDGSFSVKTGVQLVLWGGTILNLGTERHHQKYLKPIESGELPGCFLMTELAHGSNVRGIETTATYDPLTQQFDVHTPNDGAIKWWIGNLAKHGKMGTLFARLVTQGKDHGVHAFVVPLRHSDTHEPLSGIEIGDVGEKAGLQGIDNGFCRFTHVRIPRENLLNRFGDVAVDGTYQPVFKSEGRRFGAILGELIGGRVTIVIHSTNSFKLALLIATRYAFARKQFGPPGKTEIPIIEYKSHQRKLMPMIATLYAHEFVKRYLSTRYQAMHATQGRDEREVTEVHTLSAGLKATVTTSTQNYLQNLREMCGGHGYAAYNRFGPLRDDHDISLTFEGDNTVLLQQVAGNLLKEFQKQFGKGGTGILTYLRHRVATTVASRNPVLTHLSFEQHLRNPDFQIQVFEWRSSFLLDTVAMELRKAKRITGDAFSAWNECLPRLLHLARAHIELVILEQFVDAAERQTGDSDVKQALKTLCDLYALERIESDFGTFRNLELIKSNKAKAISTLITILCEDTKENALALLDAFEIPDWIVQAPLGLSNGDYMRNTLEWIKENEPLSSGWNLDHEYSSSGEKA